MVEMLSCGVVELCIYEVVELWMCGVGDLWNY